MSTIDIFGNTVSNDTIECSRDSAHGKEDGSSRRQLISLVPKCKVEWASLEESFTDPNANAKSDNGGV